MSLMMLLMTHGADNGDNTTHQVSTVDAEAELAAQVKVKGCNDLSAE